MDTYRLHSSTGQNDSPCRGKERTEGIGWIEKQVFQRHCWWGHLVSSLLCGYQDTSVDRAVTERQEKCFERMHGTNAVCTAQCTIWVLLRPLFVGVAADLGW